MPELEITASELQLGDDVELFKGDAYEPLLKLPHHPKVWWTVAELMDGGYIPVEGIGNVTHHEQTITAICVREVTKDDLGLSDMEWRRMLVQADLNPESEKIRLTERMGFITHHRLKIRRAEETDKGKSLRVMTTRHAI